MLPTHLTTNEVKNAAGTEVEFLRFDAAGRTVEFQQSAETPNLEHRLKTSHQESGSGVNERRRSMARVDKTVAGVSGTPRRISWYLVGDIPTGDIANYDEVKNALAELLSFMASTGADTTIKFDCTGTGAACLVSGSQ